MCRRGMREAAGVAEPMLCTSSLQRFHPGKPLITRQPALWHLPDLLLDPNIYSASKCFVLAECPSQQKTLSKFVVFVVLVYFAVPKQSWTHLFVKVAFLERWPKTTHSWSGLYSRNSCNTNIQTEGLIAKEAGISLSCTLSGQTRLLLVFN